MKTFRIILLLLFFLFSCFQLKAQVMQTHVDKTGYLYDWKLSNRPCNGCGSFYISVTRTVSPDAKGLYWFYIYFWNNSFYSNGGVASTYIRDIEVYGINKEGERILILKPFYLIIFPKTENFDGYNLGARLFSTNPQQIFSITWGQVIAY